MPRRPASLTLLNVATPLLALTDSVPLSAPPDPEWIAIATDALELETKFSPLSRTSTLGWVVMTSPDSAATGALVMTSFAAAPNPVGATEMELTVTCPVESVAENLRT